MEKDRLLAFSDGVIAIIITIMVLELRPPHEATLEALRELAPTFLSYVLSFIYIAIYWNNHHHMLCQDRERRDPVGEHGVAVLPFTGAVHDSVARRNRRRHVADGDLRRLAAAAGVRICDSTNADRAL
jgi:hypothetical protein